MDKIGLQTLIYSFSAINHSHSIAKISKERINCPSSYLLIISESYLRFVALYAIKSNYFGYRFLFDLFIRHAENSFVRKGGDQDTAVSDQTSKFIEMTTDCSSAGANDRAGFILQPV